MYTQGSMLEFTVYGVAQPAGSKKAFVLPGTNRAVVTDANSKSKPWQAEVRNAAIEHIQAEHMTENGFLLLDGPLSLGIIVYLPKPKSVKREHPTVRPDLTKLVRGIEDALTGIVWRDDAQVVEQFLAKRYGEPARVEIAVSDQLAGL